MTLDDALAIFGAIVLAVILFMGFRRSTRIPLSGRDPTNGSTGLARLEITCAQPW
jgi:hypothetical protein